MESHSATTFVGLAVATKKKEKNVDNQFGHRVESIISSRFLTVAVLASAIGLVDADEGDL